MPRKYLQLLILGALAAGSGCADFPGEPTAPQPAASIGESTQNSLFTLVMAPALDVDQRRMLSSLRNRPQSGEVRVARLANAPALLLQRGRAVVFNVSPTEHFVALGEHVIQRAPNDVSWAGSLKGTVGGAQLVLAAKDVTGTLWVGTTLYQIEPIGSGFHAIVRIDRTKLPPDHPPGNSRGAASAALGNIKPTPLRAMNATAPGAALFTHTSGGTHIGVLVAYTASAAAAHGNISQLIQLAVDETNTSYSNSAISTSIVNVYSAEVSYNEAGRTYGQHLDALENPSDGLMDVVHSWRNNYYADVVILVVNDGAYCGVASQVMATSSTAFAVVHFGCATGHYAFGHEIGHLQGADHDVNSDCDNLGYVCGPFQYNHGYINPSNQWRTIMAYGAPCNNCPPVQYWSNPNVIYPPTGEVMGTAADENNARVLNETASTIAGFRVAPQPPGPLSVYITGWTDVNSSPYCSLRYAANVSGGAGGNAFSWETSGIIHDNYWDVVLASFPTEGGNWIKVTVTDATAAQESHLLEIQSSASHLECYG